MSLNRTFLVKLPRALGAAACGTALLGLGGVLMCSTYPTYKDLPADCAGEQGYKLYDHAEEPATSPDLTLSNFQSWYSSTDYTPDALDGGGSAVSDAAAKYIASAEIDVKPIPDGGWCGATTAAVLQASHNNDWGCLFGPWDFGGSNSEDASGWEGIAFWARSPGQTTKGFTLSLTDKNSEAGGSDSQCRGYIVDGGAAAQTGGGQAGIDPATGTPLSGSGTTRAPFADECGNSFTFAMEVTSAWTFYPVPFSKFQQTSSPNRVGPKSVFSVPDAGAVEGTGLDKAALRHLVIRFAKESEVELWITKLAFYKKKG